MILYTGFLRRFRDPIRVPRIRENYHPVARFRENRVPRIIDIESLKIHTGYLTFSLKKTCFKPKRQFSVCGVQPQLRNICLNTRLHHFKGYLCMGVTTLLKR